MKTTISQEKGEGIDPGGCGKTQKKGLLKLPVSQDSKSKQGPCPSFWMARALSTGFPQFKAPIPARSPGVVQTFTVTTRKYLAVHLLSP